MADCSATGKDILDGYRARPRITSAFQLTFGVSNMEVEWRVKEVDSKPEHP